MNRVIIIEPSPIVQTGLRSIIDTLSDLEVVGTLSDTNRLEEKITAMRANVVILNPSIVEFHKRHAIKGMFADTTIVALLYSYIDSDILKQFQGVIDIYDEPCKIACTLRSAMVQHSSDEAAPEGNELSEREKEIVIAVAKGLMNKEIATLLNISVHTVISHRKNISRKTGIKSVSGFVVYALLNDLIEYSEINH